jgi:hypothetical protein
MKEKKPREVESQNSQILMEEEAQVMIELNKKIVNNYKRNLFFSIFFSIMCAVLSNISYYQGQKIESLELQIIDCKFKAGELKLSPLP